MTDGTWAWVDHGGGTVTKYTHLDSIAVAEGALVTPATMIGRMGHWGDIAPCTTNYLHFEVREGGIKGTRVDPGTLRACVPSSGAVVMPTVFNGSTSFDTLPKMAYRTPTADFVLRDRRLEQHPGSALADRRAQGVVGSPRVGHTAGGHDLGARDHRAVGARASTAGMTRPTRPTPPPTRARLSPGSPTGGPTASRSPSATATAGAPGHRRSPSSRRPSPRPRRRRATSPRPSRRTSTTAGDAAAANGAAVTKYTTQVRCSKSGVWQAWKSATTAPSVIYYNHYRADRLQVHARSG